MARATTHRNGYKPPPPPPHSNSGKGACDRSVFALPVYFAVFVMNLFNRKGA